MGYSARALAMNLLSTFQGEEKLSNVWQHKGQRYFWERGRENVDGSITGSIYHYIGETTVIKVASFKISSNGRIIRAPYGMKNCLHPADVAKGIDNKQKLQLACEYDGVPIEEKFIVFSSNNPYS